MTTLESVNFPGHFLRHCNYEAFLHAREDHEQYYNDATWKVVPGLNNAPESVSFESVNYPGHFLRHSGFRLRMDQFDESDLMRDDASFQAHPAEGAGHHGPPEHVIEVVEPHHDPHADPYYDPHNPHDPGHVVEVHHDPYSGDPGHVIVEGGPPPDHHYDPHNPHAQPPHYDPHNPHAQGYDPHNPHAQPGYDPHNPHAPPEVVVVEHHDGY